MKKLLITLSLIIAAYSASMAQCTAWWMGWSDPNFTATFVDSSGTDPNVTTYLWDFGDGSTSTDQNPTHQYTTGGWYEVCFSIDNQITGGLCFDTRCDSIYIGTQPSTCNSLFTITPSPNSDYIFTFNNQSQVSGGTASYAWDFGDGGGSSNASPTHTYLRPGLFYVCLTVNVNSNTGGVSCTSSYCDSVYIGTLIPCSAQFGYQNNGLAVTYNSGGPVYYNFSWNLGDGSFSSARNLTHTYNTAGTYNVCLTIIDSITSCTDTYCTNITVSSGTSGGNCDATFTAQNSPSGTFFYADSTVSNSQFYAWDFGDGSTSTAYNPTHNYSAVDTYYVCLTVTDTVNSCTDTYCTYVAGGSITNPNNNLDIQGLVYSDSSTGVWSEAMVYLIEFDSLSQTLSVVDSQVTQGGYYIFSNVAAGSYLLKAALVPSAPAYGDFLPTYYYSVLFWYDAATVSIPTGGPSAYYNIDMIAGSNPGGPGFIGGNVNQGANKTGGDPLSNVQVMLLNMDNSPVAFTYSSSTGGFSFDDLAYGTYKVYAEVLGKPTYPNVVTISANKESVSDVAVVVEENGVYSSVKEVDATFVDGTNFFPNPVAGTGTLTFNAKEAGNVTVRVLNMLGQVVLEQQTQVLPGSQTIMVDMNNQQAGAYILSISFNNNTAAHTRFIRE